MGPRHALWLIGPILLAVAARLLGDEPPPLRGDPPPADCRRWIQVGPTKVRCLDRLPRATNPVPDRCRRTVRPAALRSGDRIAIRHGTRCAVRRMDARLILALEIPVDVNRAGQRELSTLPGVGPALARRILAHRQRRGPFRRAGELLHVSGIGPGKLRRMQSRLLILPVPPAAAPIDP